MMKQHSHEVQDPILDETIKEVLDPSTMLPLIARLSNAFAPSGLEEEAADEIQDALPFCGVLEDSMGNMYLFPEEMDRSYILLDAHIDEVGFMIQSINKNGTMTFLPIGGLNPHEVYGQKVLIRNEEGEIIPAVCGTIPVHYTKSQELDFPILHLDAGFTSRQEALDAGITPGCFGVYDTEMLFNEKLGVLRGKAFDDRIGCAAMIAVLRILHKKGALQYTMAAGTTQEEVGERGAQSLMRGLELMERVGEITMPLAAICFEGCPADDTFEEKERIHSGMKMGPMIRARDRSMITHPDFLAFAKKIAKEKNLPLQIAVRTGGGTNGGTYHLHNIPTLVIGIPVRYAHAAAGFCSWQDFCDAVQLAVEIVTALNSYFAQVDEED